jgi:hypothetical protein
MATSVNYGIALSSTGLCNQLFFLFSAIYDGIKNNIKIINIDYFLLDIETQSKSSISEIIDIDHLNELLIQYDVKVVDKYIKNDIHQVKSELKLIRVDYGGQNITSIFSQKFLKQNSINIPKKTNLNRNFGDPKPFVKKSLKIQYMLNNVVSEICRQEENGYLLDDIIINIHNNSINSNISKNEFKLIGVTYGEMNVTSIFSQKFLKQNSINIPKKTNLNQIFGDPKPFVKKSLKIEYVLNNNTNKIEEKENNGLLMNDIVINIDNNISNKYADWRKLFNDYNNFEFQRFILNNFKFNTSIIDKSILFLREKNISVDSQINLLHLRMENDSIFHWCKINNLTPNQYKMKLEEKYIDLILKTFDKQIPIIVLSYSSDNNVLSYLKTNNYNYHIRLDKNSNMREYEAAIDLQIGLSCNNIFIGCESSTFSQVIHKKIKNKQTILINLENVDEQNIIIKRNYN